MDIRRLNPDDASLFSRLHLRALSEEPMSFSSSPEEHAKFDIDSLGSELLHRSTHLFLERLTVLAI